MKIKLLLILLMVSFAFTGCGGDLEAFEEKAEGFAQSDKHINREELEKLKSEVALFSNDRAFKKFYTADAVDENKLVDFLKNQGWKVILATQVNHKQDIVNVYLEKSASMFGYVNGDTGFKNEFGELLVKLSKVYMKKNIQLHFINSGINRIDIEGNVVKYPYGLTENKLKAGGDVDNSDINDIYRQIIDKTPEKTISILLSDCIYSVSGDDTAGKLEQQKSLMKYVFQDSDMSTLVVKLNSAFNGVYYPKNNTKQKINQSRPYYISILGSAGAMGYFYNNVKFQPDFKGYEDRVFLSSSYNDQSVYHTLVTTHNSTDFRPIRDFSDSGSIRGMEDITVNDRDGKPFKFSVAIDLISVPVEEDVAINPLSYIITKGDYKITGIERYNPKLLKPASVNLIKKSGKQPTHIITFSATTANYSDLEFRLKNEIPQWVYATSTNDDTNVKNLGAKTFGFKYLIEGINEAHQTDAAPNNYFKINIKINH